MSTEARRGTFACAVAFLVACTAPAPAPEPARQAESWNVTAWGRTYEVFPEVDALAAGRTAVAHTHVTVLDGFAPLARGTVEIVLRGPGEEAVFRATEAAKPGIFAVELRPETPGDYDLFFRLTSAHGEEEIRGGRVRVGTSEDPGTTLVVPAPRGATDGGEPLAFLKEEQWRTDFATAWVRTGRFSRSVEALARVRPVAGGEATLTAPVDAVLHSQPWPYLGQRVERGAPLFRLVPRVAADKSLPALAAEASGLATELAAARGRLGRLEELLRFEATSRREVEELSARVEVLEAKSSAAAEDLEAARAARQGGIAGAVTLKAPFAGAMASVTASPGAVVEAGETLARLVRTDPLWLEAAVTPEGARLLSAGGLAGIAATLSDGSTLSPDPERVRLVSVAPELDPSTGRVTVLVELPGSPDLVLGTVVEARLLLSESAPGVVVPASAVVDDGGVAVAYLQLSGERFARQPVRITARQGDRVLVEGLVPGQRLVTRGGEAIRRSSLMASGQAHGHVH